MLKHISYLLILYTVLFFSCKKDEPIYPAPPVKKTDIVPPFKLQDRIYPNPCQGIFTISTNTNDSQNVLMVDAIGRTKLNITIYGTTAIVDTSLSNGVYFVHLSGKSGTFQSKLVIEK